jgi:restriction endonuclease S subunit
MRVAELFELRQGNSLELANMDLAADGEPSVHFVARTEQNNGVVAKVRLLDKEPFPAGCVTTALGGSVLSSFVQDRPFYTGFHVMVLVPKTEMRLEEKLFYCHCIKMNAYRYGYGRQANKTLKDINLPELPSWIQDYHIDYSKIETKITNKLTSLHLEKWKKFKMGEIFSFQKGQRLTKESMESGDTPFIGAIDSNNGVRERISVAPNHLGNCLTVNYNGSIGETFYQPDPFFASDDVNILRLVGREMNPFLGLFLATVIRQNKYRFGYGRKWTLEKMKDSQVLLPATHQGSPDWQFMENYIRALPHSDKISTLEIS